jgi:protein SCO1/2
MKRSMAPLATVLVATAVALSPAVTCAHDADAHAHHHQSVPATVRSTAEYVVPDVKLLREDGRTVQLSRELNDGHPIVLNFIYTTCTSVCPLTTQTFAELQDKLGAARDSVHLVSISIDPEQDTPARLHEYAQKFGAGPQWRFYTGTPAASVTTQRAFNVYRGSKMDHAPVTLMRLAPGAQWVRIDGFATADQLLGELRTVVAVVAQ